MAKSFLNDLLKEYEQKRINAQRNLEYKKSSLYSMHPELEQIEQELNQLGIQTAKHLLKDNNPQLIENFNKKISILKEKRNKILSSLSLSMNDLQPYYDCSYCKDTGYITLNHTTQMCSCLKQRLINISYNKSNISRLDKENFSTFKISTYSDEINKEKFKSEISPRENMKRIQSLVNHFISNFDNPEEKSLLFIGNTGLGKTFLSNCIAKELMDHEKVVIYQTAPNMLDNIIDYRFNKGNVSSDFYEDLISSDLLIIDDLGTESMNSIKFTELFNIINARILNQKKSIISTNLTLQNLFSTYDERIVSRLVGFYHICRFFGDDIRFKQK